MERGARLACFRRTASVHSEPGSNSSKRFTAQHLLNPKGAGRNLGKRFVTRDRVITSYVSFLSASALNILGILGFVLTQYYGIGIKY